VMMVPAEATASVEGLMMNELKLKPGAIGL
jgi:hypothetical protein